MYHRPEKPVTYLRDCLQGLFEESEPNQGARQYPWNTFVGNKKRRKLPSATPLGGNKSLSVLPPIGSTKVVENDAKACQVAEVDKNNNTNNTKATDEAPIDLTGSFAHHNVVK